MKLALRQRPMPVSLWRRPWKGRRSLEKQEMFTHSVGVTDVVPEIDFKTFSVIYTHSMIDVSERRIMYGTYYHVRSVPRPGMFLLTLCGWLVTLTLVQYNHTTDYIFPLDT